MELTKSIITIETILHSEQYPTGNLMVSIVEFIEHNVIVDGDLYYSCKQKPSKYSKTNSPIRAFEEWLLAGQRRNERRYVRNYRGQFGRLFKRQSFKVFNLKLQLAYLKLKLRIFKFIDRLLCRKASGVEKLDSPKIKNQPDGDATGV